MTDNLPQLSRLFLTDAGLETDLIYNRGVDLPCFASIMLLRSHEGRSILNDYFRSFLDLARSKGTGCVLESASWRAGPDWAPQLGLSVEELDALNRASVTMLRHLRDDYPGLPFVVSGCIGPRGDGYDPGAIMMVEQAETYHRHQASILAEAGADMLSALTMTNSNEAAGIARVARELGIPVAISFTVETDGRLPTGETLEEAIAAVDKDTDGYVSHFMINCAHPTHFEGALDGPWVSRIAGIRANASRCSHTELDAMTELDDGDPAELARQYRELRDRLPHLNVLGGCCGTDLRHVRAIAESCASLQADAVA